MNELTLSHLRAQHNISFDYFRVFQPLPTLFRLPVRLGIFDSTLN